jgi:hypothetical protein
VPGRAGGYPPGPPTDPYVRHARIRFLRQSGCCPRKDTLLRSPLACRGQGWCALSLSPVSGQRMRCPTAPALPWVAGASLPHLPRYSAPRRLPPCPSRRPALVARSPIPGSLPACVVSQTGSWPGGSPSSRQGFGSAGPPCRHGHTEAGGSPTFPSDPDGYRPRSQTPVVSCTLAIARPGLLPSSACNPSAFPSRRP